MSRGCIATASLFAGHGYKRDQIRGPWWTPQPFYRNQSDDFRRRTLACRLQAWYTTFCRTRALSRELAQMQQ